MDVRMRPRMRWDSMGALDAMDAMDAMDQCDGGLRAGRSMGKDRLAACCNCATQGPRSTKSERMRSAEKEGTPRGEDNLMSGEGRG
jgi:hypothetical protein